MGCAEIDDIDGGDEVVESVDGTDKQTVPPCQPDGGCGSGPGLIGVYFDNKDFSGASIARVDPVVGFDWGRGSPDPSIGADTFSVRWTGFITAQQTESHTFYTVSDDGVRLWIGDKLVIDNWTVHAPTENRATVALERGRRYPIKLEYFEHGGGAVAKLLWSSPSISKQIIPESAFSREDVEPEDLCPDDPDKTVPGVCGCGTAEDACTPENGLSALYFDNQDFSGATVARIDPVVNFSWGRGSPDPTIGVDSFSVRWRGFVQAGRSESYTFYTLSDDGIRLKVDGQVVVENRTRHGPTENSGTIALEAGRRIPIELEFFEAGGGATAKLSWSSPSVPKQIIPESSLFNRTSDADQCPEDPNKTAPGVCGCGTADVDGDADGTLDCDDECPADASKVAPGACGCGTPDTDANGNGIPDCNDEEDQTCGRLDPSVDTSKEKYAGQACCLCGDCSTVPKERQGWYVDENQKTCTGLDFEFFRLKPRSEQCFEAQRQYRETCCNTKCTPPAPIEQEWEPVSVWFPEGRFGYCDLCKNGQYPRSPYNVTTIATVPGNPTCADLYWMGRTNNIPASICYPIQNFMEAGCGCLPPDDKYPQGDDAACDICPNGQVPLRPAAYRNDIPGNPTCMDLYWQGRAGNLSSEMCQQAQEPSGDPCGCMPLPAK
jgi:hypothetical protein